MRVAELIERRHFRIVEQEPREPAPGEVLAKVLSVGVCGSDLHNFCEGSVGDIPSVYPMVLGHEPAGVIVKTGPGVSGWAPGDRVALEPAIYCYHCEFCRAGKHNVCSKIRFMSQPEDPGFFREFVTVPARNLLPLPANLSFREATLFEPLAIILHSMKFVQLQPAETTVVFGAGPIGLLTIAALRLAGASRIWAVEPVPARREMALHLGADATIDPCADDPVRLIASETAGRGVDVSIDCAAKGESINQCLSVTRNAGRVVVTGIPSDPTVTLNFHTMRRKELAFYNVRRSNHESELAFQLLSEQPARFVPMLTHTRSLEDVESGFRVLEAYADGVGKLVIDIAAG